MFAPPSALPAHRYMPPPRQRILMLGATGTIGRATAGALVRDGHEVLCVLRPRPGSKALPDQDPRAGLLQGTRLRYADVRDRISLVRDGLRGERFDALVSCLASRTGEAQDAWAIDHQAHVDALAAAGAAGVGHMVLLSAICVQKPLLAFQKAKLAFERVLIDSGLNYSIVRPTAFFKSLSGQVERVRRGKPFLVFGDGRLTACKPISDRDLADYLARCLHDEHLHRRILPIGGPGEPITPRDQGELLFRLIGRTPRFREVPVRLLDGIAAGLAMAGRAWPALQTRAELARIGRYYATESMLVLNPSTGRYDGAATPSTGADTLAEHYERLLRGEASHERGEHAVF